MARRHAHQGEAKAALRLLEAVTPAHRDAWLLKASVACTLGREEDARAAEFEAAALADARPTMLPVPGGAPN